MPTKSGSGGPALTVMLTGLGCGQEVPATGFVLITMPGGMVDDPAVVTAPGVRPAFLSAASAAGSGWPVACGTPIMTGPEDAEMGTNAPREARAAIDGSGRVASALGMALLGAVRL